MENQFWWPWHLPGFIFKVWPRRWGYSPLINTLIKKVMKNQFWRPWLLPGFILAALATTLAMAWNTFCYKSLYGMYGFQILPSEHKRMLLQIRIWNSWFQVPSDEPGMYFATIPYMKRMISGSFRRTWNAVQVLRTGNPYVFWTISDSVHFSDFALNPKNI